MLERCEEGVATGRVNPRTCIYIYTYIYIYIIYIYYIRTRIHISFTFDASERVNFKLLKYEFCLINYN